MSPHGKLGTRLNMALLALLLACAPAIASPRLVALLITDNIDHVNGIKGPHAGVSIGPGVANNAQAMKAFLQEISLATKLPLIQQEVVGADGPGDPWTCPNINSRIKSLDVRSGDTVVVYYAGHGYNIGPTETAGFVAMLAPAEFRKKKPTEFPFLVCNRDLSGPSPNLDMIAKWIAPKKPRLTIVMADACNSDYPGSDYPDTQPHRLGLGREGGGEEPSVDRRLISLFRDARGTVLIAGSKGDHKSWYDLPIHPHPMGFFTKKFLRVMDELDQSRPTNWATVGARLTLIRRQGQGGKWFEQQPFLSVSGPFKTVRSQ